MQLSNTAQQMLANKKGYRNDNIFGEGVREIDAVAIYETFNLENNGIPEMMLNTYGHFLSEMKNHCVKKL